MNEIYHFIMWGIKKLDMYFIGYITGMTCICVGLIYNIRVVALIGLSISGMYTIHLVIWIPLKYYFAKFRKEKLDTFNTLNDK